MWWSVLLLATLSTCIKPTESVTSYLIDGLSWLTSTDPPPADPVVEEDLEQLKQHYDNVMQDTLHSVMSAHNLPWNHGKKKRSLDNLTSQIIQDDKGVFRLQMLEPMFPLCPNPTSIAIMDFMGNTYAVCVNTGEVDQQQDVTIGILSQEGWTILAGWEALDTRQLATFVANQNFYILAADAANKEGADLVIYDYINKKVIIDHTVHCTYPTAVKTWKMKDGKLHLAIANSGGPNVDSFRNETFIYHWMGTYFDKYTSIVTYDVKDLEPFHIHSSTYLAVVNHRMAPDSYEIDSEIYKYSIDQQNWISVQRIRTYAAMDCQFFSLGSGLHEEFFLAIANNFKYYDGYRKYDVNSIIYKFVENKFVPFQCLLTAGATSIAAFRGYQEEFLLAVGNRYDSVQLYQHNGRHFVPASIQYTRGSLGPGVWSLDFAYLHAPVERPVLVVANPLELGEVSLYGLTFKHENRIREWYSQSLQWCQKAHDESSLEPVSELMSKLDKSFFIDQKEPIHIRGNLTFSHGLKARNLRTHRVLEMEEGHIHDSQILYDLKILSDKIAMLHQRLENMKHVLARALHTVGDQEVAGEFTFEDADFVCADKMECTVGAIETAYMNGENVADLEHNVIFTDMDQVVAVPVAFDDVVVAGDCTLQGLLDGMDPSNLVTRSGNHRIIAPKHFAGAVMSNDLVAGLVNGMAVNAETVLLVHGDQVATGDFLFSDMRCQALRTETLNGIDLDELYSDVVTVDGNHVVTGFKTFKDVEIAGELIMLPGATLDGVDVIDLWEHVLWVGGRQEVRAPVNFTSMSCLKDLHVSGSINGVKIPGPDVLLVNQDAEIKAPKMFEHTCFVGDLQVMNTINGLGMVEGTEGAARHLDIMLKSVVQTVYGQKTFNSMHLEGATAVGRYVDGIDLSEVAAKILARGADTNLPATWTFVNVVFNGPVEVHGLVNGGKLEDLYARTLKITDTAIPENLNFVFKDFVQFHSLECHDINGIDVSEDLVTKNERQVVRGRKVFKGMILNSDSYVHGLINDVRLEHVADSLLKDREQTVTASKTFQGDLIVHSMVVDGTVNGIRLSDCVLLNTDEVIEAPKIFGDIAVPNLYIEKLDVMGFINGIDLAHLLEDTMTYSGTQMVTGLKTILGNAVLLEGSNLETDTVDGINLRALWEDAVLVDRPQVVDGHKVFLGDVTFGNLVLYGTIDGIADADMRHNWMLQGLDQEVDGDLIFGSDLVVHGDVIVASGMVNDINVVYLNNTIVKVDEPTRIVGPVAFKGETVSHGDVTVGGTVQGIKLVEEAVLRSGNLTIVGEKRFLGDVIVHGNVLTGGLVNGIDVSWLCSQVMRTVGNQDVGAEFTVVGDVSAQSRLLVGGFVDGVDVVNLNASCMKTGEEAFLEGLKSFDTLTLEGPVSLFGSLGSVNLNHLQQNYLSLTRDQEVHSEMIFGDLSIIGHGSVENLYTVDKMINGVNLKAFDDAVLKTYGDQTITAPYEFLQDVLVKGDVQARRVNGLSIPDDVMINGRTNVIRGPKEFVGDVSVLEDVTCAEGATVQDVDVSEWAERAVLKKGSFQISGIKTFDSLETEAVRSFGTIDGLFFSPETVLLTYGDQVVTGHKTIRNNVVSQFIMVEGKVNDIHLKNFQHSIMLKGQPNVITGKKTFTAPLSISLIELHGTVQDVNVTRLNERILKSLEMDYIMSELAIQETVIEDLQAVFDEQAVTFCYYEEVQELFVPEATSIGFASLADRDVLLVADKKVRSDGCTTVRLFRYEEELAKFVPYHQNIPSSYAIAMEHFKIHGEDFLVIANLNPSPPCVVDIQRVQPTVPSVGKGPVAAQIFIWDGKTFLLYQTLWMKPSTDVAVMIHNGMAYLVFPIMNEPGEEYDPQLQVFCMEDLKRGFGECEALSARGPRKISIVDCPFCNKTFMAVANSFDMETLSHEASIDIYALTRGRFGQPIQTIPAYRAQNVLLVTHNTPYDDYCFLVVAEGKLPSVNYFPLLTVYRYYPDKIDPFVDIQKIEERQVVDMDYTKTQAGDLLLCLRTEDTTGNVKIYRYKGESGFVKEEEMTVTGAQEMKVFARGSRTNDPTHYIAVAMMGRRNFVSSPLDKLADGALILQSKMKGRRLPYYS